MVRKIWSLNRPRYGSHPTSAAVPGVAYLLASALVLATPHSPLTAQSPTDQVEVRIRVVDARTGDPIPQANLVFLSPAGQRLGSRTSDLAGHASFAVRREAGVKLRAGALGYQTLETPTVFFEESEWLSLDLFLDADAIPLAPLEITARQSRPPATFGAEEFEHRARLGFGVHFTAEDIERLRPGRVSDLLREVPGVRFRPSGPAGGRIIEMSRTPLGRGGGACPTQIYMDGMLVTRRGAGEIFLDDFIQPNDLEAMEVYRGASTVPAEFLNEDSHCGVVVLWSRRR